MCYPNDTSRIIIIENPIKVKIAIKSFFSFVWLSGINSCTTTYIIAPAANDNKKGSKYLILSTNKAPIIPLIGSTIPLNCPKKNAFFLERPSLLRGTLTAVPSGKFCIPIPSASKHAATSVAPSNPYLIDPKATPTAKPSGLRFYVSYNV